MAHPRTDDTVLYVSQMMTRGIDTLPKAKSEDVLEELFAHLYRSEGLYEHDWHERDLVAWDNIAIQHAHPQPHPRGSRADTAEGLRSCARGAVKRPTYASSK